ncbi:MAG: secretin N-terminal domain-containing protein [Rhodospirillaceae bacterium]
MNLPSRNSVKPFAVILSIFLITGCTTVPRTPITTPLIKQKDSADSDVAPAQLSGPTAGREKLLAEPGLMTPIGRNAGAPVVSDQPPSLTGQNISINFEGVALPAFINTVFGELLNLTFEIDSAVLSREQLVTLRTAEPATPDSFYQLVTQVLANYGISIAYQNGVYRVIENAQAQTEIPRIIRSRAFSNVPGDMRPVFYYATVDNIRVQTMQNWLSLTLRGRLDILIVPFSNALILLGTGEDIAAALDLIEILDQPTLAGSRSLKISPAYWSVDRLTTQLLEVLQAEGYSIERGSNSVASIKLIPVQALNTIIVFATSEQNLRHVTNWAAELDQPGQTINTSGVFYHQIRNTNAEEVAALISQVLGTSGEGTVTDGEQTTVQAAKNSVVVDTSRNAIIFQGTAEQYSQFRSLADQMDKAPYEVLIEATVAEVTLDQGQSLGAVLNFDDTASASNSFTIESSEGLAVNLIRDNGSFTASLNAAADESRVSILSSPRLVAASGKTATMQVGTQVPIITTQQTAPDGSTNGTSNILQQVQYRNTGVVLTISPVVNSSQRVELTIQQEVSDAQANDTSGIQSPLILTRGFSTTLSIDDGETVLLAGLISENFSKGNNGIPYLKDIPLLGNLFKNQSQGLNRTELIVLLTPYIIDNRDTSRLVRDAFRSQLGELENSYPQYPEQE